MRSTYSDDEEKELYDSDDSVLGAGRHKVGVQVKEHDRFNYVDAMTNRFNESDARLLRAAINDEPKDKPIGSGDGDNETGRIPRSFTGELTSTNQAF